MPKPDELSPLWIVFPYIPKESIGWRMGAGDDYLNQWLEWWRTDFPADLKEGYQLRWPEPQGWLGFYASLTRRNTAPALSSQQGPLADATNCEYACLKCAHTFVIAISALEAATKLSPTRTDTCDHCLQRVGTGPVKCRNCGTSFELSFPHWHLRCNLAAGECPACGTSYSSACIC